MRFTLGNLVLVAILIAVVLAITFTRSDAVPAARVDRGLQEELVAARPGTTVVLKPKNYGQVLLQDIQFTKPIRVDASKANFAGLILRRVDGIIIDGATVKGPREAQNSILIDYSRNVTVSDSKISGARIAVAIARSQGINVLRNDFTGTRSDGVNIAMSQHIRVIENICRGFNPIMGVNDAFGKLSKDGDHPDCIQAWSRPNYPPTSDVEVIGNIAEGYMQGIFFGDPGNGGYDRIVVKGNRLRLSLWNGILLYEARDSLVTGNDVSTIPGSRAISFPFHNIVSSVKVINSPSLRACGNRVEIPYQSQGILPC